MLAYKTPKSTRNNTDSLRAASHIYAGVAGLNCSFSSDTLDGRHAIKYAFSTLRTYPDVEPEFRISIFAADRQFPALQAASRNRICDLSDMLIGPEKVKRFISVGSPARKRFADTVFGEDAVLEIINGELVVLKPELLLLYAQLAFLWLLQSDFSLISVHGALLAVEERATVLVAPSGSGKSTLAYALAQQGAAYHGDEWAIFRQPGYEIYPWPRPLCLRPGGHEALGAPLESPDWCRIKPDDPKCKISLPEPAQPCPRDKASFFFLDGFTDAPKLSAMPGGEATRRLLQGMSCAEQSIGGRLEIAADLVNRYPSYRLAVGPPHETAALVMAHMRGQG